MPLEGPIDEQETVPYALARCGGSVWHDFSASRFPVVLAGESLTLPRRRCLTIGGQLGRHPGT